ncbi:hypothetical protein GLAREA_10380 [Glarea lozoyensis ATCC 20868]|uniref:Uncharacterized protein n=1 Tax=Glarea lozoyensis (strain ATCC 20868 / MF5171) TaxID=1116229 RepID=S3DRT8_GLAL2|nr:uncharacterized protein GLAREA_10380 [Glarea lozoyensis ATCC 20868]EPE34686.1 hypothetical protein GLAREA_10380 [Glarea lozoyensis ATCC 20868]
MELTAQEKRDWLSIPAQPLSDEFLAEIFHTHLKSDSGPVQSGNIRAYFGLPIQASVRMKKTEMVFTAETPLGTEFPGRVSMDKTMKPGEGVKRDS